MPKLRDIYLQRTKEKQHDEVIINSYNTIPGLVDKYTEASKNKTDSFWRNFANELAWNGIENSGYDELKDVLVENSEAKALFCEKMKQYNDISDFVESLIEVQNADNEHQTGLKMKFKADRNVDGAMVEITFDEVEGEHCKGDICRISVGDSFVISNGKGSILGSYKNLDEANEAVLDAQSEIYNKLQIPQNEILLNNIFNPEIASITNRDTI